MGDENVNVMVEAKKEYTAQLCNIMCPFMIETFIAIYNEAETIAKGKKILLQYQRLLKEVPNWNNHMIEEHNTRMNNNCSWFNDLLAAVFVSNVKILSSVRLKAQNEKISVKLPSNEKFIHSCYINAAKDLYKDPYMFTDEDNELDEILTKRFVSCIVNTIQDMIPIQEILKTYISQDSNTINVEKDDEYEDPEVDEELPIEEEQMEEGVEIEGVETEGVETEGVETENVETEGVETEGVPKNIPIQGAPPQTPPVEDDVLFPSAPSAIQKTPQ